MKRSFLRIPTTFVLGLALLQASARADTKLFDALRADDIVAVKGLLTSGVSPSASNELGVTALAYSAAFSSVEMMRALLDAGATVNDINKSGATALMWASGDAAKVRVLLSRGATVTARDQRRTTPLMVAGRLRNIDVMKELIVRGALRDVPAADLPVLAGIAYSRENAEVLDTLMGNGLALTPAAGAAPGVFFVNVTNAEMTRKLLASGADASGQARLGLGNITIPVLGIAAFHGNLDVVRAILDSGVSANVKGTRGFTPVMMAAAGAGRNADVVRLLIDRGATLDDRDENGRTALDWALALGETAVVRVLRQTGAQRGASSEIAPVPSAKPRPIRTAIEAALARLQPAGPAFRERTNCISCHHQSLPAIAIARARTKGIALDEALASHPANATLQVWGQRAERSLLGDGLLAIPPSDAAYGLWQFAEESAPPNGITDAVRLGLARAQGDDGAWHGTDARPPLSGGFTFHVTALAIRALQGDAPPALRPSFDARVRRAVDYLRKSEPHDTQEEVFKLLGLVWARATRQDVVQQTKRVEALQRKNGGWAQLPTMEPDAYATGQALYALASAGVPASADNYKQGMSYLLRTQLDDATWFVRSRAFGFQPYFDAGFPHGKDQFISIAATAWAVIALTEGL